MRPVSPRMAGKAYAPVVASPILLTLPLPLWNLSTVLGQKSPCTMKGWTIPLPSACSSLPGRFRRYCDFSRDLVFIIDNLYCLRISAQLPKSFWKKRSTLDTKAMERWSFGGGESVLFFFKLWLQRGFLSSCHPLKSPPAWRWWNSEAGQHTKAKGTSLSKAWMKDRGSGEWLLFLQRAGWVSRKVHSAKPL